MEISTTDCTSKEVYKLLSGTVVPRPIAFVATKSKTGIDNLAPFSFFTPVSSEPPTIMFSIGKRNGKKKDTLINIEQHREFTINIVTEDIARAMHHTAADFRADVSEFAEAGLTPVQATMLDCMAVKEAPIHMECTLEQVIPVGKNDMVLGRVVHFRIEDGLYMDPYKINHDILKPLGRLAGNAYSYTRDFVELKREVDPDKLLD
ncbi:flavin reductase family protein [Oceanobacillus halotolerans]|uniref:flavin reductase family protein n=1 Tax=Oceanobacillus halotolerans TaxID=2663380 RepID=UPI0013DBAE2B|nr:flavin reductase family protein [Oceanobacillus halotolerans]